MIHVKQSVLLLTYKLAKQNLTDVHLYIKLYFTFKKLTLERRKLFI